MFQVHENKQDSEQVYMYSLNPYKIKGKTVAINAIPSTAEPISVVITVN